MTGTARDVASDPPPGDGAEPERPLRRDAERNRQRMLVAAREVFAERGLAATLDDIARHAGMGVGTVYRRYPNKDSLVEALFEQRIDELVAVADAALELADPWDGVVHLLTGICERFAVDRGLRDVVLGGGHGFERIACARQRIIPAAQRVLDRAQRHGVLRADARTPDVPVLALMINTVCEYAGPVAPGLWRRYLAIMLDGLRAPGGAPLPDALDEDQLGRVMSSWHSRRS